MEQGMKGIFKKVRADENSGQCDIDIGEVKNIMVELMQEHHPEELQNLDFLKDAIKRSETKIKKKKK
jgi:uncharacterized protein YqfB (UPF0267 family)